MRSGSEIRPNADQSDISQVFGVDDICRFWMDISGNHQGQEAVRSTPTRFPEKVNRTCARPSTWHRIIHPGAHQILSALPPNSGQGCDSILGTDWSEGQQICCRNLVAIVGNPTQGVCVQKTLQRPPHPHSSGCSYGNASSKAFQHPKVQYLSDQLDHLGNSVFVRSKQ